MCPTLCDPIDGSPPGSPVPGILQARILGWVAISFGKLADIKQEEKEAPGKFLDRLREALHRFTEIDPESEEAPECRVPENGKESSESLLK